MSSKKSLGSSPIGFSGLNQNSYQFIRDLGVSNENNPGIDKNSNTKDDMTKLQAVGKRRERWVGRDSVPSNVKKKSEQKQTEKKIVSYYLEIELINDLKLLADKRGEYYSSVVSKALRFWLDQQCP